MDIRQLGLNELIKLSVKQGTIPQYVYKYRPLNTFTDQIFETSSLWFSKPSDFNDPFDCQVVVDTKNTEAEISNFLKQYDPQMVSRERKRLAKLWSKNPLDWKNMITATIADSVNEKGICCFAGNNNNILMWSHYTDSHKGICLKFDILEDTTFFSTPFHVKYSKDYPYYNHFKDNSKMIELLIQTKADIWNYEGEVRVLKPFTGNHAFKKEAVKEIIFGCNCPNEEINRVKNLVTRNKFTVVYKKAAKSPKQFSLNIK